ncbi:MAG: RluA family pseudouridine synthase [Candidatus Enteromonas sp.]|nr:RluA family pseudouridine synthase [Candidatus Enteromonas sp.]MDY6094342.1 RluA family pseudouridine synthase [Candidatus Enteromonas sp.]
MKRVIVDSSIAGKRLDEALFALKAAPSRSKTKPFFEQDLVRVNGKKYKAHDKVEEGDEIVYEEPVAPQTRLEPQDIPLNIVYEDDDILVIDKPAGLVVHPGNGHSDGTLVNGLLFHRGDLPSGDARRPGIVHRIDKDTSGLLVCAKSELAFSSLSEQLSDHSMHREYYALVKGIILEDDGKIDAPIGRSAKDPLKNEVRLKNAKEAITYFHVEKRFKKSDVTFISCRLLTGRTHQIRVHMEYIGHPIIGDPIYGEGNRKIAKDGQLLHAYSLTLTHPRSGESMTFSSPLPQRFLDLMDSLR